MTDSKFKRSSSYFYVSCHTLSWRSSLQSGATVRQTGRQAFCHKSRKLHEHEQERTDIITTSNDIDFFRGKNCYVNYTYIICCNKFTTLALLTKRRTVSQTLITPRCFMSHRHLRTRAAETTHLLS